MKPPRVALTRRQLDALRQWAIRHRPVVLSVRLFGSRASGRWCTCSDVDLAIGIGPAPNGETAETTYFFERRTWGDLVNHLIGAAEQLCRGQEMPFPWNTLEDMSTTAFELQA
jgi:hypothetical protein